MRVLAIDQGTSGTKALVVDADRGVLGAAEVGVRPTYLPDGGVEQDPHALWDSVMRAGAEALAAAGTGVDGVAVANQGETVLGWDRSTGEPRTPAIVWQDRRSAGICRDLAPHADRIAARTGLTLDPYFSAPKLAWLRRTAEAGEVVTTTDTWLIHRLTGAFVTDAATAGRSLLLDLDTLAWDDELVSVFDLAGEALPDVVGCDEVVGTTDAFGPRVPVGGLIVDQPAALLAERCLEAGTAKCTFGTGAFLLANAGNRAVRSTTGLSTSPAWTVQSRTSYYLDGPVYAAASAVRWLVDLGLLGSATDLDAAVTDDAGDVLCVPALAGLAAPWWRPDATASLTGMTLSTGRGQIVRAVVEGLAAQLAELADCLHADLGRPLARLNVDGGLTRSAAVVQATADVLQLPVDVYPSPDATALGVAALGRLALDPSLSLEDAVPPWSPAATFEPRWSADRAAAFRERWRGLAAQAADGGTTAEGSA